MIYVEIKNLFKRQTTDTPQQNKKTVLTRHACVKVSTPISRQRERGRETERERESNSSTSLSLFTKKDVSGIKQKKQIAPLSSTYLN